MTDAALAAAAQLLPGWVAWANVLLLAPAAALLCVAVAWTTAFVASRPLRKATKAAAPGELVWHERARLVWPLERSVTRVAWPLLLMVPALAFFAGGPFERVSSGWLWLLLLAVVFRSIRFATRPFRAPRRETPLTWKQWFKALLFVALLFARLPVIVAMAFFIGPRFDRATWIAAAAGLGALVLLSSSWWIVVARAARLLRPPSARLVDAVRGAATRIGLSPPTSFEADLPVANAFAVPRQRLLVVTSGALKLLDDEELAAVCSHELGHLTEGRAAQLVRAFAIVALLPLAFAQPIGTLFHTLIPGLVPAPFIGTLIALGIGILFAFLAALGIRLALHHFEQRADQIAHRHEGESGVYVRALEKLHREARTPLTFSSDPTRKPGLLRRMFASDVHGSFAERVVALGGTPPPDLKPPSRWRFVAATTTGAALLVVGLTALVTFLFSPSDLLPYGETSLELAVAFDSSPTEALTHLARRAQQRGATDDALVLGRAAVELSHAWPSTLASLAGILIDAGRFAEATTTLDRAERECEEYREDADLHETLSREVRDTRAHLDARRAASR